MEPTAAVEAGVDDDGVAVAVAAEQAVVDGLEAAVVHTLDVDVAHASAGEGVDEGLVALDPHLV